MLLIAFSSISSRQLALLRLLDPACDTYSGTRSNYAQHLASCTTKTGHGLLSCCCCIHRYGPDQLPPIYKYEDGDENLFGARKPHVPGDLELEKGELLHLPCIAWKTMSAYAVHPRQSRQSSVLLLCCWHSLLYLHKILVSSPPHKVYKVVVCLCCLHMQAS